MLMLGLFFRFLRRYFLDWIKAEVLKSQKSDRLESYLGRCKGVKVCGDSDLVRVYKGFQSWFKRLENNDPEIMKHMQGMKDYNVPEFYAFHILAYTARCSKWINSDYRDGVESDCKCKDEFAVNLDTALGYMPSFENGIVYRMDSPGAEENEVLDWYESKIGSVFCSPHFLSTAKFNYNNSSFVWKINTCNGSNGRDISNLTNAPNEQEVLFKRNSKFKIESVNKEVNVIELSEVIEGLPDFNLEGLYWKNI